MSRRASDTDLSELLDILDYLELKESTRHSKATPAQIQELAKKANASIWAKVKIERQLT